MCISKLTPEVESKIISMLMDGNYITTACLAAGITRVTFYDWKKRGEQGKQPYAKFLQHVEEAESIGETQLVQDIKNDD